MDQGHGRRVHWDQDFVSTVAAEDFVLMLVLVLVAVGGGSGDVRLLLLSWM